MNIFVELYFHLMRNGFKAFPKYEVDPGEWLEPLHGHQN